MWKEDSEDRNRRRWRARARASAMGPGEEGEGKGERVEAKDGGRPARARRGGPGKEGFRGGRAEGRVGREWALAGPLDIYLDEAKAASQLQRPSFPSITHADLSPSPVSSRKQHLLCTICRTLADPFLLLVFFFFSFPSLFSSSPPSPLFRSFSNSFPFFFCLFFPFCIDLRCSVYLYIFTFIVFLPFFIVSFESISIRVSK